MVLPWASDRGSPRCTRWTSSLYNHAKQNALRRSALRRCQILLAEEIAGPLTRPRQRRSNGGHQARWSRVQPHYLRVLAFRRNEGMEARTPIIKVARQPTADKSVWPRSRHTYESPLTDLAKGPNTDLANGALTGLANGPITDLANGPITDLGF